MSEPAVEPKRYLIQDVIAKCSRLRVPVKVVLEITYRCNLHCAHCYVDVDEPDELTLEEWKGIIEQLKAAGTIYLLFTGGEIMMRDDFLEIASYARRSGFIPELMSNCTLLTPDIVQDIAELKPFSITTSLYGATAATHDSVTGVTGSHERTLEGIRLLVEHGMVPLVQTLVMKPNLNELDQIERLVTGLGAKSSIDIGLAPSKSGATYPLQLEPDEEELINCGWRPPRLYEAPTEYTGLCKAGKATCSISPRGDLFPCSIFPLKLGNLKQLSFDTMWRLEPCAELRYLRSMRRTDLYACNQCHLEEYCKRCAGVACLESGRPDGPSTSACRQARMRWRLSQAAEVKPC